MALQGCSQNWQLLVSLQTALSGAWVIAHAGDLVRRHQESWRALTYRDGKPHYWKLGTYPQVTVQQARRKAREYFENPQKVENAAEVGSSLTT
jgi:hypothetical protein